MVAAVVEHFGLYARVCVRMAPTLVIREGKG